MLWSAEKILSWNFNAFKLDSRSATQIPDVDYFFSQLDRLYANRLDGQEIKLYEKMIQAEASGSPKYLVNEK